VKPRKRRPDVQVENHGTICLMRPTSEGAVAWLKANTDGTWFGGALAVEPRYVDSLVDGLREVGFSVAGPDPSRW
jgi:hypothetical protein